MFVFVVFVIRIKHRSGEWTQQINEFNNNNSKARFQITTKKINKDKQQRKNNVASHCVMRYNHVNNE